MWSPTYKSNQFDPICLLIPKDNVNLDVLGTIRIRFSYKSVFIPNVGRLVLLEVIFRGRYCVVGKATACDTRILYECWFES